MEREEPLNPETEPQKESLNETLSYRFSVGRMDIERRLSMGIPKPT